MKYKFLVVQNSKQKWYTLFSPPVNFNILFCGIYRLNVSMSWEEILFDYETNPLSAVLKKFRKASKVKSNINHIRKLEKNT